MVLRRSRARCRTARIPSPRNRSACRRRNEPPPETHRARSWSRCRRYCPLCSAGAASSDCRNGRASSQRKCRYWCKSTRNRLRAVACIGSRWSRAARDCRHRGNRLLRHPAGSRERTRSHGCAPRPARHWRRREHGPPDGPPRREAADRRSPVADPHRPIRRPIHCIRRVSRRERIRSPPERGLHGRRAASPPL